MSERRKAGFSLFFGNVFYLMTLDDWSARFGLWMTA
jgi:hypothetical protein